jgi:hypothetical protein
VSFGTLVQHGDAKLRVYVGTQALSTGFDRVIAVPFSTGSGKVAITGPEESDDRHVLLEPGDYRLVAAQRLPGHGRSVSHGIELEVELVFAKLKTPLQRSEVLVADAELSPPQVLVEDAEAA